ncbi:YafY family protein [Thermocatellispora tengchongensis]
MSVPPRTVTSVNRTDRLYALVEELRAISPRWRSARDLAARFGVSPRTIERDISALQQAGVPIYPQPGRRGGYALDKEMSLPPLNFTPAEAVAIAVALGGAGGPPFARHARSALRKLVAAMPAPDGERARELAERVRLIERGDEAATAAVSAEVARVIEDALLHRWVLRIGYRDRKGQVTEREIEPGVFLGGVGGIWYLVGWCRLRDDVRVFRLDRIAEAVATGERCPARPPEQFVTDVPDMLVRHPVLD